MSIRNNRGHIGYGCLAALGLFAAAGCGDDRPMVAASRGAYRPPAAVLPTTDVTTPSVSPTGSDPLMPPDPMVGTTDDTPIGTTPLTGNATDTTSSDAAPDPLVDAGTDLGAGAESKMPTQHSHWLSVSQFGARVAVRLNGVWYGEFYGPTLRDITMKLRPGPNVLTVTYAPQSAEAWLAVHVTEGEHTPPIPDLVVYQVAPLRDIASDGNTGRLTSTTRTFRFMAQ